MAWSTPLTAVANTALNASQWNASVRDNLNATAPALAANPAAGTGRWFVSSATNAVAERIIQEASVTTAAETTLTTTYTNLVTNGPILSALTTGPAALVMISCQLANNTATATSFASFEVTGTTTSASSDNRAVTGTAAANEVNRGGSSNLISLTAGASNTFRMQYRVDGGTGSFQHRRLLVMPC